MALWGALAPAQTKVDEFVFNNNAEPETIDPALASGVPDNSIVIQVFEGLMAREPDWSTLRPGLAASYTVSDDLKTYTFKLRDNLKWSDGSPLTVKDFLYSWKRAMRPQTLAPYAYWLTDTIVGGAAYSKAQNPATEKALGLKAIDAKTLEVKLVRPIPYFLQLTAESLFYPVHEATVEKHGNKWTRAENMVSSGPYQLKEWTVNQKIVLEKNPHYYGAKEVHLKTATALPINDRQTAVNLFRQGKLDWSGKNGAPNGLVPAFRKDPNFRVAPGFATYYYMFNVTKGPLKDVRVRQALSLAIDRKTLVDRVTRGGETAVTAIVPPHTADYSSPKTELYLKAHSDNLKKAQKLLAEAGFPGGKGFPSLRLLYNTDENHKRVAQALQQMWKKGLRIDVQPYNQEWKVYLKTRRKLDYDIARAAWSGDYPDPSTFLEIFQSESENNDTGWKNKTFDDLFVQSNQMPAGTERDAILAKAEKILLEEAPIAPIYNYVNFGFVRPEVQGFVMNPVDRPFIQYIRKKAP